MLLTEHIPNFPSQTEPERKADFVIHAVSLVGFAVASGLLVMRGAELDNLALLGALVVYAVVAMFSISISFAYHLLPRHDLRSIMRRWDHAAIYVVIAGTFSPLLVMADTWHGHVILAAIWAFAAMGVWFKMFAVTIDGRWSLVSYLGLGWFALFALPSFWSELPGITTWAIAAGGIFYTIGTMFYRQKQLRFRYPIWHAIGTLGGISFFVAIWVAVEG